MKPLDLSIAILTRNSAATLGPCLQSLLDQGLAPERFEVLVVDHASTDETEQILKNFQPRLQNFFVFQDPENNLGKSRAFCARKARAEHLLFLDSDCVLSLRWVQTAQDILNSQQVSAVAGACEPIGEHSFSPLLHLAFSNFWGHFGSPQNRLTGESRLVGHLPMTACLLKKSDVLEVGNFCSGFASVCEDLELGLRLNSVGKNLLWTSQLKSSHDMRHGWRSWTSRIFRFGQGQIQVAKKHPSYLASYRILLPLAFIPALLAGLFGFWLNPILGLIPAAYFVLATSTALAVSARSRKSKAFFPLFAFYFITHVSYSAGQWASVFGRKP